MGYPVVLPLLVNAAYFLGLKNELNLFVLLRNVILNDVLDEKNKS